MPKPTTTPALARALLAAVKASGMTLATPDGAEFPDALEWTLRARTHRYLCGRELLDHRQCIQIGADEARATLFRLAQVLGATLAATPPPGSGIADDAAVWVCGPGARWVATGTHLQLRAALRAWQAQCRPRPAPDTVDAALVGSGMSTVDHIHRTTTLTPSKEA
jgi:hypothetical protein